MMRERASQLNGTFEFESAPRTRHDDQSGDSVSMSAIESAMRRAARSRRIVAMSAALACGFLAGLSSCVRVESGAGRQSVRAHGVEGSRRLYQRDDHVHRADARRLSVARHGVRPAPFRWRQGRAVAAAAGPASPVQRRSKACSPPATARSGSARLRGLASWKDGQLTRYEALAGSIVDGLLEDREARSGRPAFANRWTLCAVEQAARHVPRRGRRCSATAHSASMKTAAGSLWVGTATGLWRWKPGPPKFYPLPTREQRDPGSVRRQRWFAADFQRRWNQTLRRRSRGDGIPVPVVGTAASGTESCFAIAMAVCGSERRLAVSCMCTTDDRCVFADRRPVRRCRLGAVRGS